MNLDRSKPIEQAQLFDPSSTMFVPKFVEPLNYFLQVLSKIWDFQDMLKFLKQVFYLVGTWLI